MHTVENDNKLSVTADWGSRLTTGRGGGGEGQTSSGGSDTSGVGEASGEGDAPGVGEASGEGDTSGVGEAPGEGEASGRPANSQKHNH